MFSYSLNFLALYETPKLSTVFKCAR